MSRSANNMFFGILILFFAPSFVNTLTCHRCFGYGFCHDPEHPDFSDGIRVAGCSSLKYWDESLLSHDPFGRRVEEALNENYRQNFLNSSTQNTQLEHHCVTARVHETKNSYTLRTCISRVVPTDQSYPTLCELIDDLTESQNRHNGTFSCRQCTGDFCNTHVLQEGDGVIIEDDDDVDDDDVDDDDVDDDVDDDGDDSDNETDEDTDDSASTVTKIAFTVLPFCIFVVLALV